MGSCYWTLNTASKHWRSLCISVTLTLALSQRSSAHHPEKLAELADKDMKRAEGSRRHQREHTKTLLKDLLAMLSKYCIQAILGLL